MYIPRLLIQILACSAIYIGGRVLNDSEYREWNEISYWTGWLFMVAWMLIGSL